MSFSPNFSYLSGLIHENGDCTNNFQNTGGHFNPSGVNHPQHAGDLLPLFSNQGYAWIAFYDKRFTIPQILGKSVVVHQMSDDFHTQPSGNSGESPKSSASIKVPP